MGSNMVDQCQMVKADALAINNFMMGPSMALMGMMFGIACVLARYTVCIFLLVIRRGVKTYNKLFVNETVVESILIYSNENYSKRPVRETLLLKYSCSQ